MFRLPSLLLVAAASLGAQNLVLNHVRLIDGTGAAPVEDAAIVIEGGVIRYAGPAAEAKAPENAQTVDLEGKTVVPGIINLHGHVGNVKGLEQNNEFYTRENVIDNLKTYAKYGVTTTTSMGTDEDLIVEIRDERRRDAIEGARVFTALQGFTTMGGYPTQAPGVKGVAQETATAAQGRARVDQLAEKGADLVKMWVDGHHGQFQKLPPEMYEAIIDQAHKRDLLAFAHVYELEDAKGLVRAGIDILGHSVRDSEADQELIDLLKKNNVTYVPTLTREKSTYVYSEPPEWLDDPFFTQSVEDETIEAVKTDLKAAQSDAKVIEQGKQDFEMASKNLAKLHEAGVMIAFGTDTGPPGRFPGYFEHWEAELMVDAGLEPMEVIETWSAGSAKALEIAKEFGTLEKGKVADLIVLDANPLDDIRNTRKIHAVYMGGKRVE